MCVGCTGCSVRLLLQGGVCAMSRLSMVGNGVRLLVLLDRSRGSDVKYRLSYSLDCYMLCAAVLPPCLSCG